MSHNNDKYKYNIINIIVTTCIMIEIIMLIMMIILSIIYNTEYKKRMII